MVVAFSVVQWTSGERTVTDLHGHQNLKPPPQPLTTPNHPPHTYITQNGHNKMHSKQKFKIYFQYGFKEHFLKVAMVRATVKKNS